MKRARQARIGRNAAPWLLADCGYCDVHHEAFPGAVRIALRHADVLLEEPGNTFAPRAAVTAARVMAQHWDWAPAQISSVLEGAPAEWERQRALRAMADG